MAFNSEGMPATSPDMFYVVPVAAAATAITGSEPLVAADCLAVSTHHHWQQRLRPISPRTLRPRRLSSESAAIVASVPSSSQRRSSWSSPVNYSTGEDGTPVMRLTLLARTPSPPSPTSFGDSPIEVRRRRTSSGRRLGRMSRGASTMPSLIEHAAAGHTRRPSVGLPPSPEYGASPAGLPTRPASLSSARARSISLSDCPTSPTSPKDNRRLRRNSRKSKAGVRQFSLDEILSLSLLAHKTVVLHSSDDQGNDTRCRNLVKQALEHQLSCPEEVIRLSGCSATGRDGRRGSSWL